MSLAEVAVVVAHLPIMPEDMPPLEVVLAEGALLKE
jgi:hypothetical protein